MLETREAELGQIIGFASLDDIASKSFPGNLLDSVASFILLPRAL